MKNSVLILLILGLILAGVLMLDDESHQEPINSTPVATHSELEVVSPIMEVRCLRPNGEVRDYLVRQVVGNVRFSSSKRLHQEITNTTITTMEGIHYTVAINRCEFRWL